VAVVVLTLLVALAIGFARGGSLHRLSSLSLPGWPLVVAAVVVQAAGSVLAAQDVGGARSYPLALLISALLVAVFVALNREVAGMPLVALGFALNAAVVTANGAMPVSTSAAARAGIDVNAVVRGTGRHEYAEHSTRLRWLGDVVPAPMPFERASSVLSVGDVILTAGLGVLVASAMAAPPGRRRARADREPGRTASR
jgi:hypothetical protein